MIGVEGATFWFACISDGVLNQTYKLAIPTRYDRQTHGIWNPNWTYGHAVRYLEVILEVDLRLWNLEFLFMCCYHFLLSALGVGGQKAWRRVMSLGWIWPPEVAILLSAMGLLTLPLIVDVISLWFFYKAMNGLVLFQGWDHSFSVSRNCNHSCGSDDCNALKLLYLLQAQTRTICWRSSYINYLSIALTS